MKLLPIFLLFSTLLNAQSYQRHKKLTDTTLYSQNLNFNKELSVIVPIEWQNDGNKTFPLIIIFDRQNSRSNQYILNTIDYLSSNEQMPSSIVISVHSDQNRRFKETFHKASGSTGMAEENEKFIFEELIPYAEETLKASKFRLLIGHSRYGYFTTSLFAHRTNDLNAVISLSPFLTQTNVDLLNDLLKLNTQNFSSKKYYRYSIGNDYPEDYARFEKAEFKNAMLDIKGRHHPEADHNAIPGIAIAQDLYELFAFWHGKQTLYLKEDHILKPEMEKQIVQHYGQEIPFSVGVLNGKGWKYFNEEKYEKAIAAWELLAKEYPNFCDSYLAIIEAQQALKIDTSNTIERFHQNLKTSLFYTAQQKQDLIQELKQLLANK